MEIYYPIQQLKATQHQEKLILNIKCIFTHQIMHIKQSSYRSTYSILLTILLAVYQAFLYGYVYQSGSRNIFTDH